MRACPRAAAASVYREREIRKQEAHFYALFQCHVKSQFPGVILELSTGVFAFVHDCLRCFPEVATFSVAHIQTQKQ